MNFKKYLRIFVYNLLALWVVTQVLEGVAVIGGLKPFIAAGLALTLVNLLVRPLIKLLFLPINLLTLGAFRWLVNVVTLYLVTILVPQLEIKPFTFPGFSYQGFIFPTLELSPFWALVVATFFLSLTTSFLYWIRK
jgi:putative membrane protein